MERRDITITRQLELADELVSDCRQYQDRLLELNRQMHQLSADRDEGVSQLEQDYHTNLQLQLRHLRTDTETQLAALNADGEAQTTSFQEHYAHRIADISAELQKQLKRLEEQRQNETWILQSVLDEENDDSPVLRFDREAETYVTQKAFLDERFETINSMVARTEAFLADCHTTPEIVQEEISVSGNREQLRDLAVEHCDLVLERTDHLQRLQLPNWIKGMRIWGFGLIAFLLIWIPLVAARADLLLFVNPEISSPDWEWAGVAALIAMATVVVGSLTLLFTVQNKLRIGYQEITRYLNLASRARDIWEQKSEKVIDRLEQAAGDWRKQVEQKRRQQIERINRNCDEGLNLARETADQQREHFEAELNRRLTELSSRQSESEEALRTRLVSSEKELRGRLTRDVDASRQLRSVEFESAKSRLESEAATLRKKWSDATGKLRSLAQEATGLAAATLRWPDSTDTSWQTPARMPECISVGDILITAPKTPPETEPQSTTSLCVEMPGVLRFPGDTSILVEHDAAGREQALSFIRTQILKLLTVIPAGRIRLTLIDPVGLGQSFSAMMHLTDFDELLISNRIWTDSTQIRNQLQKVTEHMENIFQTYLRSQFETIEEYNQSAGEVAEPYHFVAIAGFPTGFSEESARHLVSILTSGPRCGVHALIAWNPTLGTPPSFDMQDLTSHCVRFKADATSVQPQQKIGSGIVFETYPEPPAADYVRMVRSVGEQSKDARRVEVSFSRIAPREDEIWSRSTADGIDLPIGRAGAARLQFLRLGRGTSQHVLVAGKTGSGKSTLLHIIITNLALHYSPDEIQFYLIDFKKGVEFRTYAAHRLPHARVVAIESDREFGLSVLERLDELLQERGELFRERGVQDVPSFRERFPAESMPRLLLLIDEFQEFFVAEDRVSARASLLLDRLVRQGRAFGIHVLLGSQTLGGAYSLARSTMGQIAVRVALQCSDNDAHLILSEDNMAARLLTRPGEAVYNDANGMVQGNTQFQVAWLDEARREDAITTMLTQQSQHSIRHRMIVFEGNVAPVVEHCAPLNAYLQQTASDASSASTDAIPVWVGEPVAIAAPTSLQLHRASGQNVLIVGQNPTLVDSLLACVVLCAAPQRHSSPSATPPAVMLCDQRDAEFKARLEKLRGTVGDTNLPVGDTNLQVREAEQCDATIAAAHDELIRREEDSQQGGGPNRVFIVRNIGQFRSLRRDDDDFGLGAFGEAKKQSTADLFADLIKRGPLVGLHVVVWSDSFSNAMRWLSGALLREFENRIAFRMNQTDSASLIDSPVAASLGPGRAVLYRDQTGTAEKFRPFAWPSDDWLSSLSGDSSQSHGSFDIDSMTIE